MHKAKMLRQVGGFQSASASVRSKREPQTVTRRAPIPMPRRSFDGRRHLAVFVHGFEERASYSYQARLGPGPAESRTETPNLALPAPALRRTGRPTAQRRIRKRVPKLLGGTFLVAMRTQLSSVISFQFMYSYKYNPHTHRIASHHSTDASPPAQNLEG